MTCEQCERLALANDVLRAKLAYIHGTAFAGEASPNAKDFRRIMDAAKLGPRIAGADQS